MNSNNMGIYKLVLPFCGSLMIHAPSEAQKNVLFLMADDYNYWANCLGYYPESYTPVIDALASRGVLFANAVCSSPVCNPSRNALWSGFRPSTTGISRNQDGYVRDKNGFNHIVTMHQYFKENGYHALAVGKMWHPGSMGGNTTDPANWSEILTDGSGCNGGDYKRYNGSQYTWSGNTSPMTTGNCNDHNIAVKIANRIASYHTSPQKDKPFFIGLGLFRPHAPFNSPKQFWDKLDEDKMLPGPGVEPKYYMPGSGTTFHNEVIRDGVWGDGIQGYLASMALTDHNVGLVLDALENSPLRDSTIVLFMGDHGFDLGEHGRWGKFAKKITANHTTFIIYDPAAKGNGQVCDKPVSLQDIYPTLIELCGLPEKRDIEGRSLARLLDCPGEEYWDFPILMTYGGGNYIMSNDWYFIENGSSSELYHNGDDPYQWNNLFGQSAYNGVVARLRSQIDSIVQIGTRMRTDLINLGYVRAQYYNNHQPPEHTSCACADSIPPTMPGPVSQLGSTATSVTLSWGASADDTGVTGYQVFVNDGLHVTTPDTTVFTLLDLPCDSMLFVKIRALDACFNQSEFSEPVQVSTGECDTIPPAVPGPIEVMGRTLTSVELSWGPSTDNDMLAGYEVFVDDEFLINTGIDTVCVLSGLQCDVEYTVKVRAVDASGNYSAFSDPLVVSPEPCPAHPIPGKIEAEDYTDMSGIQTQPTLDEGGGANIGYINIGNWVSYSVRVEPAGEYDFNFRVASNNEGGTIEIVADGISKGSVSVAGTGGWQNWTNVNTTAQLDEGLQTLRLNFSGGSNYLFNINWIDVQAAEDTSSNSAGTADYHSGKITYLITTVADPHRYIYLDLTYSDPVVRLDIFDLNGRLVQSDIVPGETEMFALGLSPSIPPGIYMIRINNIHEPAVERFVVKEQ